jgi:hypothetical protein
MLSSHGGWVLVRKNWGPLQLLNHVTKSQITSQGPRNQNKIDGQRKTFFTTPFFWFFWNYILDGEIRVANETKSVSARQVRFT